MSGAAKPLSKPSQLILWGLVVALAAVLSIAALPNYFSGSWPWAKSLEVPQISALQTLTETPLVLPGWQPAFHQEIRISSSKWSLTQYSHAATDSTDGMTDFLLLLRPQRWHDKQPEVEWVDLTGALGWQITDVHHLRFSIPDSNKDPQAITARYFRGLDKQGAFSATYLNGQSTLAVLQWYSWPTGGHPAPARWFWADQKRQWSKRERLPWVAISILLPIEPLSNVRPYSEAAIEIGQIVQAGIVKSAFNKT